MARVINFYMDDSGTRHPDRRVPPASSRNDWFALGGVLVREEDEAPARELHEKFCDRWGISYPLHSCDIRAKAKEFRWLEELEEQLLEEFFDSFNEFALSVPVVGIACIIDRQGYNARYRERYGRQRWSLCKTAFCIAVERAAKYAETQGCKLRVLPERCNKKDDRKLLEYYRLLREQGLPFAEETSGKYAPMPQSRLQSVLYDFKLKHKSSPMAQLADLYLWPMCVSGYHRENRVYRLLMDNGKLIDALLGEDEREARGIKYSCFDRGVEA